MANLLLESYNQSRSLFINGGTRFLIPERPVLQENHDNFQVYNRLVYSSRIKILLERLQMKGKSKSKRNLTQMIIFYVNVRSCLESLCGYVEKLFIVLSTGYLFIGDGCFFKMNLFVLLCRLLVDVYIIICVRFLWDLDFPFICNLSRRYGLYVS